MSARRDLPASRRATHGRVVAIVLAVIGLACVVAGSVWAWQIHQDPDGGFAPYLLALAAAPFVALAASLRVGAFVVQPSGESPVAEPSASGFGWCAIAPWRPYRAVRNGALAGTAVFRLPAVPRGRPDTPAGDGLSQPVHVPDGLRPPAERPAGPPGSGGSPRGSRGGRAGR